MNYIDIIKSRYFLESYTKIEELKKDFPVNHGFVHINNVIENAQNISSIFNLNDKEKNLLLIAATLHDIGYLNGQEYHAYNGSILAKEILKQWDFSDNDITIITNAIKNHGGKTIDEYSDIISICLIIADKLDFVATRYDINKIKREYQNIFPHIQKTFIDLENTTLSLIIQIDTGFSISDFQSSNYYHKLTQFLILLSSKLNYTYSIKYKQN